MTNYGKLDGLLHNAAILGDRVPFDHYSIEQWHRVMHANSTAVFLLTRVLMPLLQRSDAGRLLFTSSSVGADATRLLGSLRRFQVCDGRAGETDCGRAGTDFAYSGQHCQPRRYQNINAGGGLSGGRPRSSLQGPEGSDASLLVLVLGLRQPKGARQDI